MDKFKFHQTKQREGLIRAKVQAARLAKGKVPSSPFYLRPHSSSGNPLQTLVFLDSHVEVGPDWLQPLLAQLQEKPKSLGAPSLKTNNSNKTEGNVG